MRAFGREVAIQTLAGVLAAVIIAVLAVIWGVITYIAPSIAAAYNLSLREALAWATVTALLAVILLLSIYVTSLRRRSPSVLTVALSAGLNPEITLTHHGEPTTYRADGRIVSLVNESENPAPAPFRCELEVGGITSQWEALLQDGEWANIILGSLERSYVKNDGGNLVPAGWYLAVRRGKRDQHVWVPDTGAIVELQVHATPQLAQPIEPKRFRIVRGAYDRVIVTEEPED